MKQLRTFFLAVAGALILLAGCSRSKPQNSEKDFLQNHVTWLADDARNGRLSGTIYEAEAANYIADHMLQYGLEPAGDNGTFIQQFTLKGAVSQAMEIENHISRNVVGKVDGRELTNEYIIVGAHYDGQGTGGVISLNPDVEDVIHNSADDNASGTAGVLYLAREFEKESPRHSILFITFSGEEEGLLGSKHFVDETEISSDSIMAMINLDMIGRLQDKKLNILGTGTSNVWEDILKSIDADSLEITTSSGGMGSSDHASFYEKGIPVLHYFTGIHEQYHRDTDTADKINYQGMKFVLNQVEQTLRSLDSLDIADIEFQESTDPHSVTMRRDGVTLGVIPDYSYSEYGFRIDRVQPGRVADRAGIQDGDIVIEMNNMSVTDIYDYMEALNSVKPGDSVGIRIRRNNKEIDLTVTF